MIASIWLLSPATSSLPLAPLLISLLFGAGQCAVGVGLVARGRRAAQWRRLIVYSVQNLGVWLFCSGVAELIVSGLALASEWWGRPGPATLAQVRSVVDFALLGISAALVVALLLFPLLSRPRPARGTGESPVRGPGSQ